MTATASPSSDSSDARVTRWAVLAADESVPPGMRQFLALKADHPDYMLFYRMGDFYELFFDDALLAAELLDIALTKRGKIHDEDIPMCGVPAHASDAYLERLIAKGQKVAVCEQLESPAEAKKRGHKSVVRRDVVRIVTAGTLTEEALLPPAQSNYLACYGEASGKASLAWVDISTGEFAVTPTSREQLSADLARLNPKEILVNPNSYQPEDSPLRPPLMDYSARISFVPAASFNSARATSRLKDYYRLSALDSWGELSKSDLVACAALLDYILLTQKDAPPQLAAPRAQAAHHAMVIDAATRRNLELTQTLDGQKKGSLLATIDRTQTAGGARMLHTYLSSPLTDLAALNARFDSTEWLLTSGRFRDSLRASLAELPDIERSLSRLLIGRGGPRDLKAIGRGLASIASLKQAFQEKELAAQLEGLPQNLTRITQEFGEHHALTAELERALKDEVPLLARDGKFIAEGYHAALDEFRSLSEESRRTMMALQSRIATDTDIPSLKIKHNNVLGYFIEITTLHSKKVPESFIHRQSMKGSLRYTTTELAELEQRMSEAKGKALSLELEIYETLLERIRTATETIRIAARAAAELDVYAAFATLAEDKHYTRPQMDNSLAFEIVGGRHPVVEAALEAEGSPFISNDCSLTGDARLWLLTGPNMAGKSTFLRQNALIAILAQMGCFIPANSAHIGIVDRLSSRVGAADDLARGRSTFMVEMVETATILAQSTERSLVILDEIGRGTATFDGLSIAWAVVEHLHSQIRCRGLFATHYHELTHLTETLPNLACHTMRVKEWKGEVIFLHEVKEGTADRSYGIHVARLAGLPAPVIKRAGVILRTLEEQQNSPLGGLPANVLPLFASAADTHTEPEPEATKPHPALAELASLNPDTLTPREALDALYALKDTLEEES